MNLKHIFNLHILLFLVLVFVENIFGQECDSNRLKCISCNEYQKCNAGFPAGEIISCKNGNSCTDFELRQCQMRLKCYDLNECTEAGIFPDPLVDSNFYVCLSDASSGFLKFSFSCPEDNFFNKLTMTCEPRSNTLPSTESTPSTIPSTESTPSTIPSTESTPSTIPSTESTPSTIPSTESTPSTIPSTESTPSTIPSTESTPSTIPSTESTTPSTLSSTSISPTSPSSVSPSTPNPPTESPPFACSGAGIFPNPVNCKMYYRCSTSLKVFFYICPGSSFFNENLLKCSLNITPACQEQILKNLTSTPSPVPSTAVSTSRPTTTSVVTTTSSASPPTTTTSSMSTSTTPTATTTITIPSTTPSNSPFLCPSTGTYANPVDCKTYYRCSVSGKIFRYNCPGNTYFNEFTNRCSVVMTPRCKNLIQG